MQLTSESPAVAREIAADATDRGPVPQLEDELTAARREIAALRDERVLLAERVRYEAWRYRNLRSRKVWRIFSALAALRRHPVGIFALPLVIGRILFGPSVAPPDPRAAGEPDDPQVDAAVRAARAPAWSMLPADTTDVELRRWRATLARNPVDPAQLVVATVMDEFSQACFAPECDLVTFTPDGWRPILEERTPHLLLLESAWHGNAGSWERMLGNYPDVGLDSVRKLVDWCRERDVPVAFWNKEDPLHFKRFAAAAALCDVVFTTDANAIPRYEALRSSSIRHVAALPFAAQPRLHNPVTPPFERTDGVCFAGTFYKQTRGVRSAALEDLLDAALPFGLTIFDRMSDHERTDLYGFPERFADCVRPGLPYRLLVPEYKRFKAFLNVNTVEDSPTMFARRVFELLACETAVVSTCSAGISQMFGDLVPIADDRATATAALESLLADEAHRRAVVTAARRKVFAEHTYRHRLATVATTLGFRVDPAARDRVAALLLLDADTPGGGLDRVAAAVVGQQTPPYELLIGTTDADAGQRLGQRIAAALPQARLRIVQQTGTTSGLQRRRELAALAVAPWVAPFDAGRDYGDHHLTDLLAATQFADSDVVGTHPTVVQRYTDRVDPGSAIVRRGLVADRGWPDEPDVLERWHAGGVRCYAADAPTAATAP